MATPFPGPQYFPTSDPFEDIRRKAEASAKPPAAGSAGEGHEIDDPNENNDALLDEIQVAYALSVPNSSIAAKANGDKEVLKQVHADWRGLISIALSFDENFQRLVVDDFHDPGLLDFSAIKLRTQWLVGIYLPGFYEIYEDFLPGYAASIEGQDGGIVMRARSLLRQLLSKPDVQAEILQKADVDSAQAATNKVDKSIATLLRIAQNRRHLKNTDAKTYDTLKKLDPILGDIDQGHELLNDCRLDLLSTGAEEPLYEFARKALKMLQDATRSTASIKPVNLPLFTQEELNVLIEGVEQATEAAVPSQEKAPSKQGKRKPASGADVGKEHATKWEHESTDEDTFEEEEDIPIADSYSAEPAPDADWLSLNLAKGLKDKQYIWFYPHWSKPASGAFDRPKRVLTSVDPSGAKVEHDERDALTEIGVGAMFTRTTSFVEGRLHSHNTYVQPLPTESDIVAESLKYVKQ
ncbi:hypothetical protein W97_09365, partial [Coniosporium apollinis CBS 100218]